MLIVGHVVLTDRSLSQTFMKHPEQPVSPAVASSMVCGLESMETVYQSRHGGASNDSLKRYRNKKEIQLRLHHNSSSSFKIYHKPGRIAKLVLAPPTPLSASTRGRLVIHGYTYHH